MPLSLKRLAADRAETLPLVDLVRLAKLRWRIERDYQELKDELRLDHFEAPRISWRLHSLRGLGHEDTE
jgi:SRSO17 transposase